MSVGGRTIGVVHTVAPIEDPLSEDDTARLSVIADQVGSRIGMLRVMEATSLQAATDPLTGLLNRRSFEDQAHAVLDQGRMVAVAMGDLDHFKRLNDTHGHEVGDRALRLFARILQGSVRKEDLVCRYGGEEFVIAFPDLSAALAAAALERTRESLVIGLAQGSVPGFTVSFGVADSDDETQLDQLCRTADEALFRAKRDGRDRIELARAPAAPSDPAGDVAADPQRSAR